MFQPAARALKWYVFIVLVFIGLNLVLPFEKSAGVTSRGTLVIVSLPVIMVWLVAFWGYAQLRQYALALKKSAEGPYFNRLSLGVTWLAWSLPLSAIASRLLSAIEASHHSFHSTAVIIDNYVNLGLALVTFLLIGAAARHLAKGADFRLSSNDGLAIMALAGALGASYCFLTLRSLHISSLGSSLNPYHLPIWLVVISLIVPFLYAWFVGLLAAYQITTLARSTEGILYQRALGYLVAGLVAIIISEVAVQYIMTVWPLPTHLVFNYRLVALVIGWLIGGLGFIGLSYGANRLNRIEEV